MKTLLKKLVETTAPSGYEGAIRKVIETELDGHVDEMRIDGLGNLIVRKGKADAKGSTVMLAAHMDEIGLMVTHVDEKGFARFTKIGGVYPRYTAGARVRFLNGAAGVIGMEPHSNTSSVTEIEKMFIDLGVSSARDCPVEIGDVAVFERTFEDLGDRVVSKAMDNRSGVAVLIETIKGLKETPNTVYAVFTVQEEVGARGAGRAAFGLEPDVAIAVDVTLCGDTPQEKETQVFLGKGPAAHIKDVGSLADPRVTDLIRKAARSAKVELQTSILNRGYTDAYTIQTSRAGIPSGGLSIPCRYVHSPSEMVDVNDLKGAVKVLTTLLAKSVRLNR
jgi:endoglucanase